MTEMLTTLICQLIGLYIVYFEYHKLLTMCMFLGIIIAKKNVYSKLNFIFEKFLLC